MKPIFFTLFEKSKLAEKIFQEMDFEAGIINLRQFPDNESYLQIKSDVKNREIILYTSLNNPNEKILPLIFLTRYLKEMGALKIGLIAPYLAYMRQDIQFNPGEIVTSRYFAQLISENFDWLITIAPHLHRYKSLDEIYSIPSYIAKTDIYLQNWISSHINNPIIIGPDSESEQWIKGIAKKLEAPYFYAEKSRVGDKQVTMEFPFINAKSGSLVLIDDIISTGITIIEMTKILRKQSSLPIFCIGIHGIFSSNAYATLKQSGLEEIITCNTIEHPSNKIDLSKAIIGELHKVVSS